MSKRPAFCLRVFHVRERSAEREHVWIDFWKETFFGWGVQYQLATYLCGSPLKKSLSYRLTKEIHLSRKYLLQLAHPLAYFCKLENMILGESGLSIKRDKPVFLHSPYFFLMLWPDAAEAIKVPAAE